MSGKSRTAGTVNYEILGNFEFRIPDDLHALVSTAASTQNWQPPVLLLTIFQELLRRYIGQESVAVSFQRDNRARPRSFSLEGNASVADTIARTQNAAAQPEHPLRASMAADGQFTFTDSPRSDHQADRQLSTSAIHCTLQQSAGGLVAFVEYDRKSWHPSVLTGFAANFQTLLRAALENPHSPIGQLDILTASDARQFDAWNQTHRHYPALRVDELFAQQAALRPDQPALTFDGKTITYRALSQQTLHLAARLKSLGVGPDVLVGICLDRCHEMVTALLAVFCAGGAYLPLDPSFPPDRIRFMQQDARPLVVLTQRDLLDSLPFIAPHVLTLDQVLTPDQNAAALLSPPPATSSPAASSLDDLAYVLYTSGSTGRPKGVAVTHRALTNLLTGVAADLPLGPSDVFLATTTISFDISAFEIFAPLISGAHLVIASRAVAVDGELLSATIAAAAATVLQATPSGWRILLESGWSGHAGLKMLTAGEPLDRVLAQRLLERGLALWNLYGPTEATIYATGHRISSGQTRITIGKPLANYTAYVLDCNGKRIPVGAIGELHLGGIGIARGYLNRPELTAAKFIPDTFDPQPGGRLYRTGDLARFWPDGQIELLGRADNQIKLRGYRIELEEIESLLDTHPAVKQSVVKVIEISEGDQRLIAYVVPRSTGPLDQTIDARSLRDFALRTLPAYMAPASFIPLESFALTPNGKVDRKALPLPQGLKLFDSDLPSDHPSNELEKTVLACWRSALAIPDLGLDGNFFDLGGHSLLAMRMFAELGDKLGRTIPVSWLIEAPTPRTFANRLRNVRELPNKCIVPMQTEGSLPPIYLVHQLLGDVLVYRAIADCFAPHRRVYGIHPPEDFTTRSTPFPLEALAAEYVREILQQQSAGPFHLSGYSSGAVLAFEMARQMTAAGLEVGLLALIGGDIKSPPPPLPKLTKLRKTIARNLSRIAFTVAGDLRKGPWDFVMSRLRYQRVLWRVNKLQQSAPSPTTEITLEESLLLSENAYRPQPYSGSALLLRFRDEGWKFGPDPLMGWASLVTDGIEAVDVPGGHFTGMSPEVAPNLAGIMQTRMERIESKRAAEVRALA